MPDQDLFNKEKETTPPVTPETPSTNDLFADKLKTIVNDKGEPKYKTIEDALDALNHSQTFIETLKTEKHQLEQNYAEQQLEIEKRKSVEEVVNSLLEKENPTPTNPEQLTDPLKAGLDEDKVKQLVESMLTNRSKEEQEAENSNKVQNALREQYGDKAVDVIEKRAQELSTTPAKLGELAKQNPAMALSLLSGVDVKSSSPTIGNNTPPHTPPKPETPPQRKGLVNGGATTEALLDEWNDIKKGVYDKYEVKT